MGSTAAFKAGSIGYDDWCGAMVSFCEMLSSQFQAMCCRNECMDSLLYDGWITCSLRGEVRYIEMSVVRKGVTQHAAQGCTGNNNQWEVWIALYLNI